MYRNLFSCKNKVAFVTGGLGFIGSEIVRGLSDFGASVCVADINEHTYERVLKTFLLSIFSSSTLRL